MRTATNHCGLAFAILATVAAIMTIALPCYAQAGNGKISCHVEGQVEDDTDCRMVLLLPDNGTDRWSKMDTIWVDNGRFAHNIYAQENVMMCAIPHADGCNDYSQRARFFVENGTVKIRFYADKETERAQVESDAPLNKEMNAVEKHIFETFDRMLLQERHRLEAEGFDDTPEYNKVEEGLRESRYRGEKYVFEYARRNVNLVGLHYLEELLYNDDRCKDITEKELLALFNDVYAPKFPDSSISKSIRSYIASREIRPGGHFIDFTAPDLDGNSHTLSEEIAGKIALIDLWASWCGPCRRNSKQMIPIYEAYRDRGFTIVGVARERDNDKAMRKAIESDGYPWLNLIELNNRANIFDSYGLRYSAGGTVLVNRDGTIIAVNPKPEEVEKLINSILGENAAK